MSKTVAQIFAINPVTTILNNDLIYLVNSPYTPGTDAAITGANLKGLFASSTLTSGNIFVGNASNVATSVTMSGDGVLSNAGALTISKIGGISISLAGSFTTLGAFSVTETFTGATNVTFPTSGTLATTSQLLTSPLTTKGDIWVWSTTNARLPVGVSDGQILQVSSGAGTGLAWSTTTYPTTNAINTLLYASSANVISALATANSATLITSAGGVPSISQTLPTAVQGNITQLGAQSQALNMNSNLINNVSDPVSSQDAATKNYVDNIAAGGAAPVVAATTSALTVTYFNGVSGVGATLTNAGAQATFSIDGQSPTVAQRVLIKNQASTFQNGIYLVTNVGSGITNWILTRAIDYDTPSTINDTGVIPVLNGTVNSNTGWVNTTIMVTVGTTAITYVQFGASYPISLANGGTGASLTASNGGIFYSTGSAGAILAGTATANQILLSGASTTPAWSTTTYPSTNAINTIMYASSANVLGSIAAVNGGVLVSNNTGVPSMLANPAAAGKVLQSANAAIPTWSTPTYPSASGTSGLFLISDGTNNVYSTSTIPTSAGAISGKVLMSNGTNYVLSTPAYPSTSGSTGVILRSDGTNYVATTSTYPNTNAINTLLYASAANVMSALATANSSVLVTDGSGVPSLSTALPANLTATSLTLTTPVLGTPTSGTLTNCTGYTIANLSDAAWTDFSGTVGYTGFSGTPTTNSARYKVIGKTLFFEISMTGTSNATTFTITNMPVNAQRNLAPVSAVYQATNAGTSNFTVQFGTASASSTLTMYLSNNASGWTNSGTKAITFTGYYETV